MFYTSTQTGESMRDFGIGMEINAYGEHVYIKTDKYIVTIRNRKWWQFWEPRFSLYKKDRIDVI